MSEPWLSIIGLGEDGLAGLGAPARAALGAAEIVFGGARHLALADAGARGREWPVPFDVAPVLALRGRPVAVLASGDPFWHGAGGTLTTRLAPGEWRAYPAAGCVSLAAAHLGWRLEETTCLGLHAAPFERLLPHLAHGARALCLLRDGAAGAALAAWLAEHGWGASRVWLMEALGGPNERVRETTAAGYALHDAASPALLAVEAAGGRPLPRCAGLPEALFAHDGQITKSPVRALTLAALAPRPGELLWDVGAGSGSVSIEFCLAGGRALAVETRAERVANIEANVRRFGLQDRLTVVEGHAPQALDALPAPDAVFVGGGLDQAVFDTIWARLAPGARLVANGVTLETEALLATLHARHGGELLRIELARAAPLGRMRGWQPARPVVQWTVTR
ncbi:precorrin-6y C5,15-methyltransferase (decarboxylating) subunit CbiE [Rubrivivax sp. JA1024]|nr:precorrin-6y C5,15-methyltransferase (decarboxylating) subunit CbiE [Rubrivivax sp. JA1024]